MLNIILLSLATLTPDPFQPISYPTIKPALEVAKPNWAFADMPWQDNAPSNDYNSPFQSEE